MKLFDNREDPEEESRNYIHRAPGLSLTGPGFTELVHSFLGNGKRFRFQTKGFSMFPFIKSGDVVTLSPAVNRAPRKGRVVAFVHFRTHRIAIHRIIGKKRGRYMIMGDNVYRHDGLYARSDILGYVQKIERNGQNVYWGLGPERILIALFSRMGILVPLIRKAQQLRKRLKKKPAF